MQAVRIYHNIEILYEDNHLLVINKPPCMLSQGDKTGNQDVQSILKKYLKEKYQKPGNVFLALVQRLDRPVRGLMVLARTSKAASRLSDQIRRRTMQKGYLAVVEGNSVTEGEIVHYLKKNETIKKTEVSQPKTPGAQKAVLDISSLKVMGKRTIVRITLHTGRFHQIRAQLAASGTPVSGDQKYGAKPLPDKSIALQCHSLAFGHPVSKEIMKFNADIPSGFPWNQFAL